MARVPSDVRRFVWGGPSMAFLKAAPEVRIQVGGSHNNYNMKSSNPALSDVNRSNATLKSQIWKDGNTQKTSKDDLLGKGSIRAVIETSASWLCVIGFIIISVQYITKPIIFIADLPNLSL